MKKTVSILMILTIMCLCACGSAENSANNSQASKEEAAKTTTETSEKADGMNAGINSAFCSSDAIMKMFEEKGFLDYYKIYEEAQNEAPKTDYEGSEVIMPADMTNTMINKIGDKMTYQLTGTSTYTLWDADSIVSLYGEPYEYQGLFLLVNIYDTFELPDGCRNMDDYFVSCNGDNVQFKKAISDDFLISCYTMKFGYVVDMFYLVPDSTAMVAIKYEIPFVNNEEEIARLKEFGLPIITDYYTN